MDDARVDQKILDVIRRAVEAREYPIYLYGPVGRGKSFTAAYVYTHWQSEAMMNRYTDLISDSCRIEKEGVSSRVNSFGDVVEYTAAGWWKGLRDVSLLVVDEIGIGMSHEWRIEMLWKVLELRKDRPLIFTGNLSPNGIGEQFDSRIKSRVAGGTLIEFTGPDIRLEGFRHRVHKV